MSDFDYEWVPLPFIQCVIDRNSIFASTPFNFFVEGKSFLVHSALVASHSNPLGRMINGPMLEAKKGVGVLEDVDEGTFARYCQWAYSGDYKAAASTLIGANHAIKGGTSG